MLEIGFTDRMISFDAKSFLDAELPLACIQPDGKHPFQAQCRAAYEPWVVGSFTLPMAVDSGEAKPVGEN